MLERFLVYFLIQVSVSAGGLLSELRSGMDFYISASAVCYVFAFIDILRVLRAKIFMVIIFFLPTNTNSKYPAPPPT
jgi:hypothetical protein